MQPNNVVDFSALNRRLPRSGRGVSSSCASVEYMFETRAYALSRLHKDMVREKATSEHPLLRSVRPFTQRFCKITREFSGISQKELCEFLNEHPRILKLKKLPGANRFYPFTPEFLTSLENSIVKVIEYNPYGGGFLGIGAYGVPTQEVCSVIAETCEASRDYRKFEEWCLEYLSGTAL